MTQPARVFQIVIIQEAKGEDNNDGRTFQTNVVGSEPVSLRLLSVEYNHVGGNNHPLIMKIDSDQLLSMYGERYYHFVADRKGGITLSGSEAPTFRLLSDGRLRLKIVNRNGTEPAHDFGCILTFCVE